MSLKSVAFPWGEVDRPCVLVADEDPSSRSMLRRLPTKLSDVDVVVCRDGAHALFEAGRLSPAAVVLSASLPGVPAADVAAVLAGQRERVGTVAVAVADGEAEHGAAVLAAGADRLISRPYGAREIGSLLLRDASTPSGAQRRASVLHVGSVRLDWPAFRVTVEGRAVPLTLREFELLSVLMRHADKVVPHVLLQRELGRIHGETVSPNTLSVHVRHLRERLADVADIVAIRGVGYRLSVAEGGGSRRRPSSDVSAPLTG